MRVAVVGLIKAGKSTLMNALLGETLVPTGTDETTFNLNWLRYGESPALRIHFKDNRPPETRSLDDLAALTRRDAKKYAELSGIQYLEITYPNSLLKRLNLIDTPGLASYYEGDSENTRAFLRLHGKELTALTEQEASQADAVLYLFSQSLHSSDQAVLEEFQGPVLGRANPINSIGVLTKVDTYWPAGEMPLEIGERITQRLANHQGIRRLFYDIRPICARLAHGAQTLQPDEFATLKQLTSLPQERFAKLIKDVRRFADRDYPNVPIDTSQRKKVLERLGLYGTFLAYQTLQQKTCDQTHLSEILLHQSGVPELRDLILSHFGNRAYLIKLNAVLQRLKVIFFEQRRHVQGSKEQQILDSIAGTFDVLEAREHAFAELGVLQDFYAERLEFSEDEIRQLMEITGEYGTSITKRLGMGEEGTITEMISLATKKVYYWQAKSNDFLPVTRETIAAARVIARSYEIMINFLEKQLQ